MQEDPYHGSGLFREALVRRGYRSAHGSDSKGRTPTTVEAETVGRLMRAKPIGFVWVKPASRDYLPRRSSDGSQAVVNRWPGEYRFLTLFICCYDAAHLLTTSSSIKCHTTPHHTTLSAETPEKADHITKVHVCHPIVLLKHDHLLLYCWC